MGVYAIATESIRFYSECIWSIPQYNLHDIPTGHQQKKNLSESPKIFIEYLPYKVSLTRI